MKLQLQRAALLATVALVSLAMVAPLAWMLLGSVRREAEILARPFAWPETWRWGQWATAWREGNLGRAGWNSLGVTTLSVTATVLLGAAAAYALARRPGGSSRAMLLYLLGLVVPAQAAVVPLFLLLRTLRLLDTWWALVLPYTAWNLPLAVFVFHGFFRAQSPEPEEAARLDGCDPLRVFARVALPLAAPAVGVVAVITALSTWNEFLFALLFVSSDAARTLPLGLLNFSSAHSTDHGLTFAALAIISLPLLLAYVFVQRTLIEGSAGALGGE
jgi:raffinose/stachyose/melibiose transport system permease protein